jgi:hypothetical protein
LRPVFITPLKSDFLAKLDSLKGSMLAEFQEVQRFLDSSGQLSAYVSIEAQSKESDGQINRAAIAELDVEAFAFGKPASPAFSLSSVISNSIH